MNEELTVCRRCGQLLTSPRSVKKGIGIICSRLERGLPARGVRQTPKEGVEFIESGGKWYKRRVYDLPNDRSWPRRG